MAVADPSFYSVPFGEFHLRPKDFDALLRRSGSPCELRYAMPCACGSTRLGEPDPACMVCFPYGQVWDAPRTVYVFGPARKPTFRVDTPGSYETGDAYFTFPTGIVPPFFSRITLPLSVLTLTDQLVKGSEDVIRYPMPLVVDKAHWSRRVPPSGHPYVTELMPLVLGTDVVVDGRRFVWPPDSPVPDGTIVTVRFTARVEYAVWEAHDRNEGGNQLPYRAICKRLDYYLHPRGPEPQASY
jgi:hypothetical protein